MTNLVEFVQRKVETNNHPSSLEDSGIFENVADIVSSISSFNGIVNLDSHQLEVRQGVAGFARFYEKKLEKTVEDTSVLRQLSSKIDALAQDPKAVVLMTAHQPNLFPYSGVMRKIALLKYLQDVLISESKPESNVISFFGIADHDFIHNKWVRSAEIDSPTRKEGVLRLNIKVDKKDLYLPSNKIPKPSVTLLEEWKSQVSNWISENSSVAKIHARENGIQIAKDPLNLTTSNFTGFWKMLERVYDVAENLAEFNSLLLASVVLDIWKMPLLFANFSDCFTLFGPQYKWFIERNEEIRSIIEKKETTMRNIGVDSGLSEDYGETSPLWMKCDCGSKYKFEMISGTAYGKCMRCKKEISISYQDLAIDAANNPNKFEPRSIFMPIAFSQAFGMSCYIGGIGGLGYLLHSKEIAEKFSVGLPSTPFWYSKDEYLSIQSLATQHELARIRHAYPLFRTDGQSEPSSKDMYALFKQASENSTIPKSPTRERDFQLLERISERESAGNSCMIDYVVNISLNRSFDQWISFLRTDGRLLAPVKMLSVLEAGRDL